MASYKTRFCKFCGERNLGYRTYCDLRCRLLNDIMILENKCWEWRGPKDKKGYGWFAFKEIGIKKFKYFYAHRESFKIFNGEIEKGNYILHKCDNPACVNPYHLWQGTQKENLKDMHNKGREGHGSAKGENTPVSKLKNQNITEIRAMYENGKSQQKIADIFGVSQGTISSILRKITWKHIE